jgi:hypothetical protein
MKVWKVEARATGKGQGLFALYNIQRDQTVMSYGGAVVSREELYAGVKSGENAWWNDYARMVSDTHAVVPKDRRELGGHLVNHSCDPNAAYRDGVVVATRAIRKGEEITFCYGWVSIREDRECLCDARLCAGIMGVAIAPVDGDAGEGRVRVRGDTVAAVLAAAVLNRRQDVYEQYASDMVSHYAEAGTTREWLDACAAWAVGVMKQAAPDERRIMPVLRAAEEAGGAGAGRPADLTW